MERTQKTRRLWRVGVGMVVVALIVVAIWKVWPRERLLMEVAHPIVKVEPERVDYADAENEETYWLSASQLLIVTPDPKNADRDRQVQNGVYAQKTWQGSADMLDTSTHKKSHLTALTRLIQRTTVRPMWRPDSFEISPDGTWLRWQTYGGSDGWPCPRAAHLDGTHYREWTREKRGQESFFLDSQHLCQIREDLPMTVRDLLDPRQDREYAKPEKAQSVFMQYAAQHPTFLVLPDPDIRGTSKADEIDVYHTQDRLRLIHEGNEDPNGPQPIQKWQPQFPTDAHLQRARVSPQQKAVLFDRVEWRLPALLTWLHQIIPKFDPKPAPIEELWVSRADGRGLHEIGCVPAGFYSDGNPAYALEDVKWLPDGKQISFIYNATLYVVPAEPKK